jgi:putative ABC transport system permease protein
VPYRSAAPDEALQARIAAVDGVDRSRFTRHDSLRLVSGEAPVALIARPLAADGSDLPLVGAVRTGAQPAIWISEAMHDIYGWRPGQQVTLPLAGKTVNLHVAGVWRDYARQSGALLVRLEDYRALTGDMDINDVALWLHRDTSAARLRVQLESLPFTGALEFAEPGEIRAISLKIFDRSFAVTYLLEVVAIIIGLFGVAATFSAQTLSRAKEFGMLRHIGITRRQILLLLAGEGALLAGLAIAAGFVLGGCISLILVFIVNPQSFHWTMSLHLPWSLLATVAVVLLLSAAMTALMSGRMAVAGSAVRSVREDW